MRTKTILLSALLGTLGSVSLMAQSTNVYSLNAVGYINVTVSPGFNLVSCPLIASPDNTINTLLTNATGQYKKWQFWSYSPATSYTEYVGSGTGWTPNGSATLSPGQAAWLYNPSNTTATVTFVGTVPSGSLTNTLVPGFNLVSSILPTSGNLVTNTLTSFDTATKKDQVWAYTPGTTLTTPGSYSEVVATATQGNWTPSQPSQATVGGGFWYNNTAATNNTWVENFSVGQ
jgi:hypothetical protein